MASEILTLQWHQIDLVEVSNPVEALWARHEAPKEQGILAPHVFFRGGGQPIKRFYTRWDQACTAAGCLGRIPHDRAERQFREQSPKQRAFP